jgi:hypothetical protein
MTAGPAVQHPQSTLMLAENPFFVLGVTVEASRIEVEREAQKLLGMLELAFPEARTYATPLGPRARTAELVRAAVAALRDPYRRLVAELWARHAPAPAGGTASDAPQGPDTRDARDARDASAPARARPGLRRALGWRP